MTWNDTMTFYNSLIELTELPERSDAKTKWFLLACDMVLKEKNLNVAVYERALEVVLSCTFDKLSVDDWKFVIDSTRKGIKRGRELNVPALDLIINKLLLKINEFHSDSDSNLDHLMKLKLICLDQFKFDLRIDFKPQIKEIDFDEFYFIKTDKLGLTIQQRCQRLSLLINPLQSFDFDHVFKLFSLSDSELIKFMKRFLKVDERRFFKFYHFIITKNLLLIDFVIEELLTDNSMRTLELFLDILSIQPKRIKTSADFINFHVLLLLKVEVSSQFFPFDCRILLQKLEKFINKLSK